MQVAIAWFVYQAPPLSSHFETFAFVVRLKNGLCGVDSSEISLYCTGI